MTIRKSSPWRRPAFLVLLGVVGILVTLRGENKLVHKSVTSPTFYHDVLPILQSTVSAVTAPAKWLRCPS